jgi:energy-coupling factor transporter ATP-binding protein EcfA2
VFLWPADEEDREGKREWAVALDLNLHQSIVGMWIEAPPYGYLARWLPRLAQESGYLIPLHPGLNVLYGRNGAGKTQILNAVSLCANAQMSAHEGFVLKAPTAEDGAPVLPDTPVGLLKYYKFLAAEDFDSEVTEYLAGERSWRAFDPVFIPDDKQHLVEQILSEFLAAQTVLFTRGMNLDYATQSPAFDPHYPFPKPTDLAEPWTRSLVPVLLPGVGAPVTRRALQEMSASLLDFVEESRQRSRQFEEMNSGGDALEDWEEGQRQHWKALNRWVDQWQWCPLLNRRNVGLITPEWFGELDFPAVGPDGFMGSLAVGNPDAPMYLPAVHLEDSQAFRRAEWKSSESSVETTVPILVESLAEPVDDSMSRHALIPIERWYGSIASLGPDDLVEIAKKLDSYVKQLQSYLTFLPGLTGITHTLLPDGSNARRVNAGHLVLSLDPRVAVHEGSGAERRWVRLAQIATTEGAKWVVIDEPESGLHRQAEASLARALSKPPWTTNTVLVVATHSPELLNQPAAHALHIEAGRAYPLDHIDRDRLDELGLRPGDLISRLRTILLVEGEHEKIVFEELFREELESAGVEILAARGGKNMKDVFESQFLFRLTDARVVCLLDNLNAQTVSRVWQESKRLAQLGQVEQAGAAIRSALPAKDSAENKFLAEFLTQALQHGQHERVIPWSLSQPDILTYLPPDTFGLKRDWGSILARNAESGESLKPWASKTYGADFSDDRVRVAAQALDSIPGDFIELLFFLTNE